MTSIKVSIIALLLTSTAASAANMDMKRFNRDDVGARADDYCAHHKRATRCRDWVKNEPMIGLGDPSQRPVISQGVPGYAFKLITMRKRGRFATVKSEPFGVYTSIGECDAARAAKIAELDAGDLRQGDYVGPMVSTTRINSTWSGVGPVLNGTSSAVTADEPTGPFEKKDVTACEPGIYNLPPASDSQRIVRGIPRPDPRTPIAYPAPPAEPTELEVAPGSVKHWVAPRPFTRVIPGTSEVVEVLSGAGQELVFMVKPDVALPPSTNILLVNNDGEVVANLRITIPGPLTHEYRRGPDGPQIYRKDNPSYVPSKVKK